MANEAARYLARGSHEVYFQGNHALLDLLPAGFFRGGPPIVGQPSILSLPYEHYADIMLDIVVFDPAISATIVSTAVVAPESFTRLLEAALKNGMPVRDYHTAALLRLALRQSLSLSADQSWRTLHLADLYPLQLAGVVLSNALQYFAIEPLSSFAGSDGTSTRLREWLALVGCPFVPAHWGQGGTLRVRLGAIHALLRTLVPSLIVAPANFAMVLILDWLANSALPEVLQPAFPDSCADVYIQLNERRIRCSGTESEKQGIFLSRLSSILRRFVELPKIFTDAFNPMETFDQITRLFMIVPATKSLDQCTKLMVLEEFLAHPDNLAFVATAVLSSLVVHERVSAILLAYHLYDSTKLPVKAGTVDIGFQPAGSEFMVPAPENYAPAFSQQLVRVLREAAPVFSLIDTELRNTNPSPFVVLQLLLSAKRAPLTRFALGMLKMIPSCSTLALADPYRYYLPTLLARTMMVTYASGLSQPLTAHENSFLFSASTVKLFKTGCFDKIDWINDVLLKIRNHVLRCDIERVPDASLYYNLAHLSELSKYGSALFGLLGFPPNDPDSFIDVCSAASSFYMLGEGLCDEIRIVHRTQLQVFIASALTEITDQWRAYIYSPDPSVVFPKALLPVNSIAKQVLFEARNHYARFFELKPFLPAMYSPSLRVVGGALESFTPSEFDHSLAGKASKQLGRDARRGAAAILPSEVPVGSRSDALAIRETKKTFTMGTDAHSIADVEKIIGSRCKAVALSSKGWPYSLSMCDRCSEPGHESATSAAHSFSPAMLAKVAQYLADF